MLGKFTIAAVAAFSIAATAAAAPSTGPWGEAQKINEVAGNSPNLNTADFQDGCPILSPDGLQLFMASTRQPGGHGGIDIWVATRESTDAPFGDPVNLPAPVNSPANDFCPTPLRGGGLLFVSNRTIEGVTCGMGDIYYTRLDKKKGWREPRHLACDPEGPNSNLDEQGPSRLDTGDGTAQLFFSRSAPPVNGAPAVPGQLFVSSKPEGGRYGQATEIAELNSPGNDIQPNVRKDGREIVFSSNYAHPGAQGGQDIYSATRDAITDPWSAPVNVGTGVNKAASESRPSLSWDANTLLFGRAPGGPATTDIWISTR